MSDQFSAHAWTNGFFAAVAIGFFSNIAAMAIGLRINITVVGAILGLLPGVCLAIASRRRKDRNFGSGMLVGGIVMGLLGGACGWIATTTQVKP